MQNSIYNNRQPQHIIVSWFLFSLLPPLQLWLIAEAWDAGGLYQVGQFPHWNVWSEWNGKVRTLYFQ